MDKRYLTKMELCEELGVVRSTMQRYMNLGLPRFRYKGKTYFDVIAAREWYEKHLEEIERESDDNLPEDFLEQMRNEGL